MAQKHSDKNLRERAVLSAIFPAHADLQPILKRLREKYGLPDLGQPDNNITDSLIPRKDFPWDEIKRDIRAEVEAHPEIFPREIQPVRQFAESNQAALDDPKTFLETAKFTQEDIQASMAGALKFIKPMAEAYTRVVDDICKIMFIYLTTGKTEEIPIDWLGSVYTTSMFGEPIVVAMAGRLSNPKEIIERFTAEIHRVFGKKRPIIRDEFLHTAKYLRKRLEGLSVPKLVNQYIEDHPSEFTKDRKSPEFREQKRRKNDALKKALKHYEKELLRIIGDNSKT